MKTVARFLAIALVSLSLPTMANAQALDYYLPGPRLIDGSQLNKMVDVVNDLSGNGVADPLIVNAIKGGDSSLGITGDDPATVTSAGGAIAITGGAGGATSGAGGAVTVSAGATTTSGAGGAVTISAGNGAGGTNAGGDINLVPGDAVSTGIPGTLQVNGNAALICATAMPATAVDATFFVATRPMMLVSTYETHTVAAGGASTLQLTKDVATDAPGAGTDLLTSTGFDLNTTANTPLAGTVTSTVASKTFAAGNRLSYDFANAIQSSAGIVITACFAPL